MKRFNIRPWEIEGKDSEPLEEDMNALLQIDNMFDKVQEHSRKVEQQKADARKIAKQGAV
jgi:hypothetical protein